MNVSNLSFFHLNMLTPQITDRRENFIEWQEHKQRNRHIYHEKDQMVLTIEKKSEYTG